MSKMALRSGKHVLCEKPCITVSEGRELVNEADSRQKVFQWGIEDRSLIKYWMLAGIARTGSIGDVHSVDCCLPLQRLHEVEEPATRPSVSRNTGSVNRASLNRAYQARQHGASRVQSRARAAAAQLGLRRR